MGTCPSNESHIAYKLNDGIIAKFSKSGSFSQKMKQIANNAQILLVLGYVRNLNINSIPLELIYLCYKFQLNPSKNKTIFMWKQQMNPNNNNCPNFMNNYIECRHLNPSNISNPIRTNIVISNQCNNQQITHQTSCYIANITKCDESENILINNDYIKAEIMSKCEEYSISNPSAIIRCGIIENETALVPSLKQQNKDYCSAIIFDETYLNDATNNNLYGFEVELPSFTKSCCDDMIYSSFKQSIIAYQSYYNRCNKLYHLNATNSNWELLTKINWKTLSPASMINMDKTDKLFISTNNGESVLMDLMQNRWIRIPQLYQCQQSVFVSVCDKSVRSDIVHQKPVFCYNEFSEKIYRINCGQRAKQNDNNFYYNLNQNRWIKMPLMNELNDKYTEITNQSLWINNHSPNILYTMINAKIHKNRARRFKKKKHAFNNNVLFAYYDERDYTQKQWKVIPSSTIPKHGKSFSSDQDVIISMF